MPNISKHRFSHPQSYAELRDDNGAHSGHLVIGPAAIGTHKSVAELRASMRRALGDALAGLTEPEPVEVDPLDGVDEGPAPMVSAGATEPYVRPAGIAIGDNAPVRLAPPSAGSADDVGEQLRDLVGDEPGATVSDEPKVERDHLGRPKLEGNGVHY
jgi:hypothetical protein